MLLLQIQVIILQHFRKGINIGIFEDRIYMFLFLNILKNLALLIVLLFQVNYGAPEYVKRKVNAFDAP